MAQSKIAPNNCLTIPRLELNGAVLSKSLEDFLVMHLGMNFDNVYHLVDSSTVLGYLHKQDSKFKPLREFMSARSRPLVPLTMEGYITGPGWRERTIPQTGPPSTVYNLVAGGFWQRGPEFITWEV